MSCKSSLCILDTKLLSDIRFANIFSLWFVSLLSFFFLDFLKKLFIYLYLFLAVLGLRFCARAFSSCGKRGPLFIAVRGPLTVVASLVAEHKLQTRRLSNCGSRAQLLCGMWDPPRPGLEPVSPASAGRFSTAAPPGKPSFFFPNVFFKKIFYLFGCIGSQLWHAGSFIVVRGLLSLVAACGLQSAQAQQLQRVGSLVVACGLSCPVTCGILVSPPGIEPMSPALEGRFLTTGPPGKSLSLYFLDNVL